jgi:hypothetical protein
MFDLKMVSKGSLDYPLQLSISSLRDRHLLHSTDSNVDSEQLPSTVFVQSDSQSKWRDCRCLDEDPRADAMTGTRAVYDSIMASNHREKTQRIQISGLHSRSDDATLRWVASTTMVSPSPSRTNQAETGALALSSLAVLRIGHANRS